MVYLERSKPRTTRPLRLFRPVWRFASPLELCFHSRSSPYFVDLYWGKAGSSTTRLASGGSGDTRPDCQMHTGIYTERTDHDAVGDPRERWCPTALSDGLPVVATLCTLGSRPNAASAGTRRLSIARLPHRPFPAHSFLAERQTRLNSSSNIPRPSEPTP